MADIKLGEPFGIDSNALSAMDLELSINRIMTDLKTDFIFAPHLGFIYRRAKDALINSVRADLNAGTYMPGVPLQMEVPKTFRIPVESTGRLALLWQKRNFPIPKERFP